MGQQGRQVRRQGAAVVVALAACGVTGGTEAEELVATTGALGVNALP